MNFEELGISAQIVKAVYQMGYEEPTPIQKAAIPPALEGKDIIGQAQTGTGKTAAFAIPVLQLCKKGSLTSAIVLEPTRELAIQVSEEFNKIGKFKGLSAIPIYGGQSIEHQLRALKKGVDIVIGTPGRVIDHIHRGTLKLDKVSIAVLDEADEMLDMGFIDDIKSILGKTPEQKQTMLFSATINSNVISLSKKYMHDPVKVMINVADIVVPKIRQIFYEVREDEKLDALSKIMDVEDLYRCLVFCHTKREADKVALKLKDMGYNAGAIHGDYSQSQRNTVMRHFKEGSIDILVATDVAARGLDIQDVTHVINYSIPQDPESYIHRIGRTGRAGKTGIAIMFVTPKEYREFRLIEKTAKTKIAREKLPSLKEVMAVKQQSILDNIASAIKQEAYSNFIPAAEKLLEQYDPIECLAAVMSMSFSDRTEHVKENEQGSMTRLFMTIGKKDNMTVKDIVKTFTAEAQVPFNSIGRITMMEAFTFVEVSKDYAEQVIRSIDKIILKGKEVRIEKAREKKHS
ncbi:MAG: DEAD/DEAH box helicase [Deltaproteobacteria bacterium]|nr:DEAD/DEAH box helicase [Deltaproteobacteria bacterium]MCL5792174.1 DEAD/DEAH box helicase [Deltaproteobacteria bacterium]